MTLSCIPHQQRLRNLANSRTCLALRYCGDTLRESLCALRVRYLGHEDEEAGTSTRLSDRNLLWVRR